MQFNKKYNVPNYKHVKYKKVKKEHIKDIDFRTREQRQATSSETFISWYEELQNRLALKYEDTTAAQLEMLSAVLWHILPAYEYDRLRKLNKNGIM